ncbi:MAG: hydrogenase maturation protease [Hydrogenophilaceae bacterium]|nr:hydrogenase maturation protease [Hydrogenophilaceae bacterium]
MTLRILCIGSPFGGDAVAWAIGEKMIEAGLPRDCEVRLLDRPGMRLLEEMQGADSALLLDAAQGIPPGTLRRIESLNELWLAGQSSTHGIGVAEALKLAEQLGRLPTQLTVFAVGIREALPTHGTLAALASELLEAIKKAAARPETGSALSPNSSPQGER